MNPQFQRQKALYLFDMKTLKFTAQAEMKVAKTFNGAVHFHDGFIYAFGGNEKDACERFDTYANKWEVMTSYAEIIGSKVVNELNGWTQVYCPVTPAMQPI